MKLGPVRLERDAGLVPGTAYVALLTAVLACAPSQPPPAAKRARHVVLVTIDTLRADHVGAYGGSVATPHLDRLARAGAMAEQASAHTPLTRSSHVTLFTGHLPTVTGVRDNVSSTPVPELPLLSEVLGAAGYRTAGFVSSVVLSSLSGLGRGFDHYADRFAADPDDPRFLNSAQKRGDETLAEARAWLADNRSAPHLFLWLHLYDPHDPYQPPEPYAGHYPDRPYAGEVAWSDALVGRLDDALEELGLAEETLLVVTSDHGEGLGEHQELLHGFFAYQSTLHVPLLARGPGVAPGTRLLGVVGLIDLFPTILDLAGVAIPAGSELSGQSLAAALGGAPEPRPQPLYAETLVPRLRFGWSDLRVMRAAGWKYIHAPRPELYDLVSDPGETRNLAAEHPDRVRNLNGLLGAYLAAETRSEQAGRAVPAEHLERLAALGYLGGRAAAAPTAALADPKDRIEEFRFANDRMRRGLTHLHAGELEASLAELEALSARGYETPELHLYLGRALLGLGRFSESAARFRAAIAGDPGRSTAWLGLAESLGQLRDFDGALAVLRDAQLALPHEVGLPTQEGQLLRLLRRPAEARAVLESALAVVPDDARPRALLGEVLRDLGDLPGALAQLRQAVALDPERASYWNALGMTLGGAEELGAAEQAFREACRLDPTSARYAYNLGLALLRQGKRGDARPFFEQALTLRPDFEAALERLSEID